MTGIDKIVPINRGFMIQWFDGTAKLVSDASIPAALQTSAANKEIASVYNRDGEGEVRNNYDVFVMKSGDLKHSEYGTVTDLPDAIGVINALSVQIAYDEDGVGSLVKPHSEFGNEILVGIDFRQVRQAMCNVLYTGDGSYKGCIYVFNDGTLQIRGDDLIAYYDYHNDQYPNIDVNTITKVSTSFATGIKKVIYVGISEGYMIGILREDNELTLVGIQSVREEGIPVKNYPSSATYPDVRDAYPLWPSVYLVNLDNTILKVKYGEEYGNDLVHDGSVAIDITNPNHMFNGGVYLANGTVKSLLCTYPNGVQGEIKYFVAPLDYQCSNQITYVDGAWTHRIVNGANGSVSSYGWVFNTLIYSGDYLAARMGASWSFYYQGGQRSAWNTNKPL
jgi:hypothetical protein